MTKFLSRFFLIFIVLVFISVFVWSSISSIISASAQDLDIAAPPTLEQLIFTSSGYDLIPLKASAIASVGSVNFDTFSGLSIETSSISTFSNGVELYFRARNSSNNVIGFGDGSVEWERLRIINPPVLVPDGGTEYFDRLSPISGEYEEITRPTYIYDPESALKSILEETVKLVGIDGSNVIDGKRGHTTTVVYPDPGDPGTNSIDAMFTCNAATWANAYSWNCTGGQFYDATGTYYGPMIMWDDVGGGNINSGHSGLNFLTDFIGTDTIDSAVVSFKWHASSANADSASFSLYSNLITSPNNWVTGDGPPANFGTTQFSASITAASVIAAGADVYTDVTVNPTGIAAISTSGVTKFAFRYLGEVANSAPSGRNYLDQVFQADATGSTNDPKMTIVTSVPDPTPTSTPSLASTIVIPSSGNGYVSWLVLLLIIVGLGGLLIKKFEHE